MATSTGHPHAGGSAPCADAPLDEQLAARGLSPKLSPTGHPLSIVFQDVLNKAFPPGQQPTAPAVAGLACAAAIAHGIRGLKGVTWLNSVCAPDCFSMAAKSSMHMQKLATSLLSKYSEIAKKDGWQWGSLREGRLSGMSGGWFLRSLTKSPRAAHDGVTRMAHVFAKLVGAKGGDLAPEVFIEMMCVFRGVHLRPGTAASKYTAMDCGRLMWLWAVSRDFVNPHQKLHARVFALIMRCQRPYSRASHKAAGVVCSETFHAKLVALQRAAAAAPQAAGGVAPPLWPNVSIHLCEMSQVRRGVRPSVLRCLVRAPCELYAGAVAATRRQLASGLYKKGRCQTRILVDSAIQALRVEPASVEMKEPKLRPWLCNRCGTWAQRGDHRNRHVKRCVGFRTHMSSSAAATAGGSAPPVPVPVLQMALPNKRKLCTHCGKSTFKLARHWASAACLRSRASTPVGESVAAYKARCICTECGADVVKNQIVRHQRSAACCRQRLGATVQCEVCEEHVAKSQINRHRKTCAAAARSST